MSQPEQSVSLRALVAERADQEVAEPLARLVFETLTQTEFDHLASFLGRQGKLHEAQEQLRMVHQIKD